MSGIDDACKTMDEAATMIREQDATIRWLEVENRRLNNDLRILMQKVANDAVARLVQ